MTIRRPNARGGAHIAVPPVSTDTEHPAFCFRFACPTFRLSGLTQDQKISLVDRLDMLSQLSWRQLKGLPREHGYEPIDRSALRQPVPSSLAPHETLLSFRVTQTSKFRLVGYREEVVLHVIWVDPKGLVYRHGS